MIYTFEISLNGGAYAEFTPTNIPKITTSKMEGEFIWRDEVDSFKINAALNSSLYDSLAASFDSAATFGYTNTIRIKKSTVVKYSGVFGIKRGELNYESKYYEVTPETLDEYTDILYYKNRNCSKGLAEGFHYVDEADEATQEVDEIHGAEMILFEDYIKTSAGSVIGKLNGFSDNTYTSESAFLWNDNYPDGTSPGANNYISSDYNYLNYLAISSDNDPHVKSIEAMLKFPRAFQCYWYCASDYTIHFEHVKWFEDMIADYQLDISGLDYDDDSRQFKYSTPEIYNTENFSFPSNNGNVNFDDTQIVYDNNLVNYSEEKIDFRTDYDAFLESDFADLAAFMAIGSTALAVGYQDTPDSTGGWDAFVTDGPDCTDGQANGSGNFAFTNYMQVGVGESLNYSITVTYSPSLTNNIQIQGYNGVSAVGSPVSLNAGFNSGLLPGSDRIRITSTGSQDFSYTLTVTATHTYRIPYEAGEFSSAELQNTYLSWSNILERFWKYSRYAEVGTMNKNVVTFESTKPNKEQKEFKFYHAADIDPMRGILTDYGTGMIQTMERDLASDFITLTLRYE